MGMLVSKTFLVLNVNNYIGNREAISLPPALLGAFCDGRCSPLPFEDIDDFSGRLKRDRALFIYSLISHQFGKHFINDFWSVFCKELQRTKLRSSMHTEFDKCSLPFLSSDLLLLCLTKVMRLGIAWCFPHHKQRGQQIFRFSLYVCFLCRLLGWRHPRTGHWLKKNWRKWRCL